MTGKAYKNKDIECGQRSRRVTAVRQIDQFYSTRSLINFVAKNDKVVLEGRLELNANSLCVEVYLLGSLSHCSSTPNLFKIKNVQKVNSSYFSTGPKILRRCFLNTTSEEAEAT